MKMEIASCHCPPVLCTTTTGFLLGVHFLGQLCVKCCMPGDVIQLLINATSLDSSLLLYCCNSLEEIST